MCSSDLVGLTDIAVVTVSERPTRIIATVIGFVGAALMPQHSAVAVTCATVAWAGLGVVGLVQMIVTVRRALMSPQ